MAVGRLMFMAGLAGLGATALAPVAYAAGPVMRATVALAGPDGRQLGDAKLRDTPAGLRVTVRARGLPPGPHGLHLHMVGRCLAPDFASAGGHWNPTGHAHGRDNPRGAHAGDLPNLSIGADGRGKLRFVVPGARLTGSGGLLDEDGGALVIHAGPDDYRTDPSGNSGGRIACGVVLPG